MRKINFLIISAAVLIGSAAFVSCDKEGDDNDVSNISIKDGKYIDPTGMKGWDKPGYYFTSGHGVYNPISETEVSYCFWRGDNAEDITTVVIPSHVTIGGKSYAVTRILDDSFSNHQTLQSVSLPNTITTIGMGAFEGCLLLNSVTMPESLTSIGDYCFSHCKALASIVIPKNVTALSENAFDGCESLKSVTLYCKTVKRLGWNLPSLSEVTLGEGVEEIGESAFSNLEALTTITLPRTLTKIGNYAFSQTGLTSFVIPASVTKMGEGVFSGCDELKSLSISLKKINQNTLGYLPSLTELTLGEEVETLGEWAFGGMQELTDVTCLGTTPPTSRTDEWGNGGAFDWNVRQTATLHVPSVALSTYKAAPEWKDFKNIVAM